MSTIDTEQITTESSDNSRVIHQEDTLKINKSIGKVSYSWKELSEKSKSNIEQKSVLRLAKDWGVSEESLFALDIGFDKYAYTFPMRDAKGEIIGIRTRPYKDSHSKGCIKGSSQGLFIPNGVTTANVQMICEGESDTPAAFTLDFAAIGRSGATVCQDEIAHFLSHKLNACPCIVADNNQVGRDGAGLLAAALLEAGIPCRVLCVPDPYADLRDWLKDGLRTAQLRKQIEELNINYPGEHPPGFFMIPNALIRKGLITEIGAPAFAVLSCISSFNNKHGVCWPGREQIADLTGFSTATVDRAKRVLKEHGLLWWKQGRTNKANVYYSDFGPCKEARKTYRVRPALLPDFADP